MTSRIKAFTSWGGPVCVVACSSRIPCSQHLPSHSSTGGSLRRDWPGRDRGWARCVVTKSPLHFFLFKELRPPKPGRCSPHFHLVIKALSISGEAGSETLVHRESCCWWTAVLVCVFLVQWSLEKAAADLNSTSVFSPVLMGVAVCKYSRVRLNEQKESAAYNQKIHHKDKKWRCFLFKRNVGSALICLT